MRISRLTAIAARFTLHGMSPGKRDRVARHHPHWVGSLVRKVEIEPLGLAGPAPHGRPLVAPFVKEAPFVEDAVRVIIKTAGVGRDARAFWTLLPKCGAASCLSMALTKPSTARKWRRSSAPSSHEHYITADEARKVIPRLPDMCDEPFADSPQIPAHLVSRFARAQVTVALIGNGGNELFGG